MSDELYPGDMIAFFYTHSNSRAKKSRMLRMRDFLSQKSRKRFACRGNESMFVISSNRIVMKNGSGKIRNVLVLMNYSCQLFFYEDRKGDNKSRFDSQNGDYITIKKIHSP